MQRMIKSVLAIMLLSFAGLVLAETAPDVMVKTTADEVLAVLRKDKDIQAGDQRKVYALAEEKILPHFDFERMSRMVLGKYWSKASKEQQDAFVQEFRSLLVRTYSSALSKYRNQTIEYKPLRSQPGDTDVTVKTQIVQPGGQPIPIDYSLAKGPDAWMVYDVVIEGVSMVTNYRGQFSTEVRASGMEGLIQKLSEKNKQLSANADKKQG